MLLAWGGSESGGSQKQLQTVFLAGSSAVKFKTRRLIAADRANCPVG